MPSPLKMLEGVSYQFNPIQSSLIQSNRTQSYPIQSFLTGLGGKIPPFSFYLDLLFQFQDVHKNLLGSSHY